MAPASRSADFRRVGVHYAPHHIGIPTEVPRAQERYAARVGTYTSDDLSGALPIQRHRFDEDSSLQPLLRSQPHLAYKVSDLDAAWPATS
ncbi:hypothetical protein [Variovorax sp. OV329]|uniref:hypothetical protein n=1 Tax=Variovorax sp. OV329 TaxID=1882825 RepID=UPI0008E0BB9C|nr:hypothetical protein [Variovorax sp. OV329]SFM92999.1 hypothetical protein SAMN05444747_11190 [Variovorax sp. OV329]